ncbi:hypothetical protein Ahy_A02g005161 [Arachis hypogaea]|uniref:CCHC-type domain-containing protein n=1 Tax=Arachis hypogaea TaxID=3818 RepID=A0A445E601_ARAHY|nr:hypothetical protein Ahy_A02g005161 [Arachis hypogaea]
MEFWIQVHGLLLDYIHKEAAIQIGNMLGVLAEAEDPKVEGVLRRYFLRIRVGINITKQLPKGFWLARESLPHMWVHFRYERLPDCYCFNCGIIGHEKKSCTNPTAMASWDPTKPRYSAGLGVHQGRSNASMAVGSSKQEGWKEREVEEEARGWQSRKKESEGKQDTEESMIRAEQVLQQEFRKVDFLKNQSRRVLGEEQVQV